MKAMVPAIERVLTDQREAEAAGPGQHD
jgi:hypothetical protein